MNRRYLLIFIILAILVGGGVLVYPYWWQRIFYSQADCNSVGVECVQDIKNYRYIRMGWVLEGEHVELLLGQTDLNKICAPGLTAVDDLLSISDGSCGIPKCFCYVCVKCPNGKCGPGENKCNCPQDCK